MRLTLETLFCVTICSWTCNTVILNEVILPFTIYKHFRQGLAFSENGATTTLCTTGTRPLLLVIDRFEIQLLELQCSQISNLLFLQTYQVLSNPRMLRGEFFSGCCNVYLYFNRNATDNFSIVEIITSIVSAVDGFTTSSNGIHYIYS